VIRECAQTGPEAAHRTEHGSDLARAAAPVLKRDGLDQPVVIDSIELLKGGKKYFVRVRSKEGAMGISVRIPPRAGYLDRISKNVPPLLKKDARADQQVRDAEAHRGAQSLRPMSDIGRSWW
jgi:hypothetical protein